MKSILLSIILLGWMAISSCSKDFLKKPQGSDNTVDSIFSTRQKSLAAIADAYAMSLTSGIRRDDNRIYGMNGNSLSSLSGEIS
jgi:starch-binding outer membrane protein, SusD/RagB family